MSRADVYPNYQNLLTVAMTDNLKLFAKFTARSRLSIRADKQTHEVVLTGMVGGRYQLEGSANLIDWIPLTILSTPTGFGNFIGGPPTALRLYYRGVSVEP